MRRRKAPAEARDLPGRREATTWSALFGVEIHDPLIFAVVPAVLALVGLLSAAPPARRAATVNPITALREE